MSYPVTVVLRLMHLLLCRHHRLLLLLLLLGNVIHSVGISVAKVLHLDLRLNLGQVGRRGWCGGHSLHLYGHHARGARKQRMQQAAQSRESTNFSPSFLPSFFLPSRFSLSQQRFVGRLVAA